MYLYCAAFATLIVPMRAGTCNHTVGTGIAHASIGSAPGITLGGCLTRGEPGATLTLII